MFDLFNFLLQCKSFCIENIHSIDLNVYVFVITGDGVFQVFDLIVSSWKENNKIGKQKFHQNPTIYLENEH